MVETPKSLLDRLRTAPPDSPEWNDFVDLYKPWLQTIIFSRWSLQPEDADDVLQEALMHLCHQLRYFKHNGREGSFRCNARKVLVRTLNHFVAGKHRLASKLQQIHEDLRDETSDLCQQWEHKHDAWVIGQLVKRKGSQYWPEVYLRVILGQEEPAQVAHDLGIKVGYLAVIKHNILKYLCQELAGLIDPMD